MVWTPHRPGDRRALDRGRGRWMNMVASTSPRRSMSMTDAKPGAAKRPAFHAQITQRRAQMLSRRKPSRLPGWSAAGKRSGGIDTCEAGPRDLPLGCDLHGEIPATAAGRRAANSEHGCRRYLAGDDSTLYLERRSGRGFWTRTDRQSHRSRQDTCFPAGVRDALQDLHPHGVELQHLELLGDRPPSAGSLPLPT